MSPAEFIPALEESGLIIDVGEWVIRQACRDLAQWRARGLTGLHVAVNVSARQFRSPHLTSIIEDALASSGLPGSALEIELTESSVMTDTELSIAALTAIKAHGVRVSVDDFGTGYSSLAYLKKLPVDVLKVDRSCIRDIPHADDGSIANCVIALGSTLGLTVIAEGVETAEQLTFLNNTGCTSYQGYLFSRPLPAEDCFDLLMTQSAPGAQVDTPAPTIVAPKFSTNRVV